MSPSRTAQCGTAEAQSRLRTARAYLEVAALVLDERDRDEYLNVSAGLAVLAGIARPPTASAVPGYAPGTGATTTAEPQIFSAAPPRTAASWQSPSCGSWTSKTKPTTV
jgi:hypothetical protein